MKYVLAGISDLHAGSTVGLCPPGIIQLGEGGVYQASPAQEWLHVNWLDFWRRVKEARKGADWFGVLANGDLVDGDHHGTVQTISREPGVQSWILKKLFSPVLALKPDKIVVVRGTETHVGKNAGSEETFARWLANEKGQKVPQDAATQMYSHWHFLGTLGTLKISATHHGRIGQRPWTKATAVATLAAQIFYEYSAQGQRHPDFAFRSHFHTFSDSYDFHPTRVIQTPAWQLHTAYAYRVVPEVLSDIGGIILTVETGRKPVLDAVLYTPARPEIVRLA